MPLGEKSYFFMNWGIDEKGNRYSYEIDLRPIYNYKEVKQMNLFEVNYGRHKQKED